MTEFPLVLALDITGQPHRWITYEDAAYYYAKDLVAWTPSEDGFTLRGGTSRMTGEQSQMNIESIIAIRGKVMSGEKFNLVPRLTNKALFRRDHNVCAYCGDVFVSTKLTRDHIHPRSKGGPDNWKNVVSACGPCNRRKDDKTLEQAGMKLLYVPYEPNRAEYLILMNKKILADQMEFLLKQVPKHSRLHQ